MERWKALGTGKQAAVIVGVFLLLAVIASAAGGGSNKSEDSSKSEKSEKSEKSTSSSGKRMDSTDFTLATNAVDDFDGEIDEFLAGVSDECAQYVGVGALGDAVDCIQDAYSGVNSQVEDSLGILADASDGTSTRCQNRSATMFKALLAVGVTAERIKNLGDSLRDPSRLTRLREQVIDRRAGFAAAYARMREACEPN